MKKSEEIKNQNSTYKNRSLVFSAMMLALTTVATLISFPAIGGQGYVNFGDSMVIISGALLGGFFGVAAAGIGSALADLFLGYAIYAPASLVIKSIMALVVWGLYRCLEKKRPKLYLVWFILSGILAEIIMSLGYFLYESLLYGRTVALLSLPSNLLQSAFGIISATLLGGILVRIGFRKLITE